MSRLKSLVRPIVPGPVLRVLRSFSATASDTYANRPNRPDEWEREYLTTVRPVASLAHPVAQAIAGLSEPGDSLLEAGCGSESCPPSWRAVRQIELADFSVPILERASRVFVLRGCPRLGLTCCDLTKLPHPWSDNSVDVVWSSGVLEHWTDVELIPIVSEMARVARKRVVVGSYRTPGPSFTGWASGTRSELEAGLMAAKSPASRSGTCSRPPDLPTCANSTYRTRIRPSSWG